MLTILLVIIAYAAWRVHLYRAAKARFAPQFPHARCLSWRAWTTSQSRAGIRLEIPEGFGSGKVIGASRGEQEGPPRREWQSSSRSAANSTIFTWEAGIDGALAGLSVAEAFSQVDPAVLNAIDFSTADHIDNLASVDSYVHDHFFASPDVSAEGWLHRLEGYVAEQKAAAALEQDSLNDGSGSHGAHPGFPGATAGTTAALRKEVENDTIADGKANVVRVAKCFDDSGRLMPQNNGSWPGPVAVDHR